jgi:FkbM family methyltransferase
MIARVARFANDLYYLLRTPHPFRKKMALGLNLCHPSGKMMGFDISYFDRPSLKHLYREIFARQYYYYLANTDSPVVFDCGANVGMATLYFKWLYPKARIQAFEPDPQTFALLNRNITQNRLTDVVTHNCALWDENEKIEFFVNHALPGSLLMSTDGSRLGGTSIPVPGRRLSDFIQGPVDLLKIDVEGAEHRILSDLVRSEKIGCVRQMVIEYHHHVANQPSRLAGFLAQLEHAGFEYQIHASLYPVTCQNVFQDMLIGAYRKQA